MYFEYPALLWLLARNGEWFMRWRLRRTATAAEGQEAQAPQAQGEPQA